MPMVRGSQAQLLAPGLNMSTFDRYREHAEEYRMFMNVKNSKKAYEEDNTISSLGPLQPKGELETTILDEPINLGLVRYIHQTFALGFAISKEMLDDDQYNLMMSLAGQLGRSARFTNELYGADVYNLGFVTTRYVGRDGLALFALNHRVEGTGGTLSNTPAVAVDLSQAALEAGIQNFENQLDERGMPIDIRARRLIVSPENRMLAKRLLNSQQLPGTDFNDVNPLMDEGITPMTVHYFTDKDAWFLLGDPSEVDVNFYWREMPDTKTWDDDNADATFHKIRQRLSVGFGDWRGTYGSPGA